ncbi:MAG: cache domain-containing protein [Proteobacteria bacterium]|nr:cache domain-containing protein [Pseudomonadota bacterium]MBU1582810.1 cache domain-containing protein [Pseudomonadota bacterium]MBU2454992.1 cache domain-containing protein [Pseudomonadota bacterium]MBU2631613.1 cache domain-containing protein [Pseudomonadota bacterium]
MRIPKGKTSLLFKTLPVRMIVPVAFTILLFILTIFVLIIPLIEKNMMDGKREAIMHLTESAWSTLDLFYSKAQTGLISQEVARQQAISYLQQIRYGPELEDYFWVNDMTAHMIMHPYRRDLEGKGMLEFRDPAGKQMFVEMVNIVKKQGSGYVDYLWQWKGNADKIVPKISYVKGFAPWGWVIGTGIYVEDVRQEILAITHKLILTCSGIMALFIGLSGVIIWQGAQVEKERKKAMEQTRLREKQLLQADKMTSLGILVAGVAHEINNPAASLMLNAPNLKKAWNAFAPVLDEHFAGIEDARVCNMPYREISSRIDMMLTAIEDSSARIKKIITDLRDFSRPAGADMEKQVDVNQVVRKSLDLIGSILKKSTHHLSFDLEEGLPKITGNSQKLQQVMINLLVNACQALENPEQAIHVKTSKAKGSHFIAIEVTDTGPGVSREDLRKLKDPFFTTKRDNGGTGLGLSISEKIVYDHMGIMEFMSDIGKGLTVKILLPFPHQGEKG